MQVFLCGVRGSLPSTGAEFDKVGGNTSCVAIAHDDKRPSLVLDAGTGLRVLAKQLAGAPFHGRLILGHMHWDHIIGLPFFPAGDNPAGKVELYLPEQGEDPAELLARAMGPPLFPITPHELRGDWSFHTYGEETMEFDGFTVTAREIPHKGGRTMGLRVTDGTSTVAYLSDHAPHNYGPGDDGFGPLHDAAVELAQDADLLLHDAQYLAQELPWRATWGHAAADYTVTLAEHCNVKRALLFHHDPSRTDDQVFALHQELMANANVALDIAKEGDVIHLP